MYVKRKTQLTYSELVSLKLISLLAESESESEAEKEEESDEDEDEEDDEDDVEPPIVNKETLPPIPQFPTQQPIKLPSGPPPPPMGMPPAMMFRPPPLRPNMQPPMAIRMPPGPPPVRPGMPPMPRMGIRMPPGPPPGLPPNRMHQHNTHHKPHTGQLSAGPQLTKDTKGMTTITAKPQIRYAESALQTPFTAHRTFQH